MHSEQERPLTLFMVTNNYTPYGGGIVSSLNALVTALREQGHRVIIVTLDFGIPGCSETDVERISCIMPFNYKGNHMALPVFIRRSLRNLINKYKPDIIHVHHPFLLGPAAITCAREYNIRTVFTYHTFYERYVHYVPLPACITSPLTRLWVRSFCKMVDHIIAPSQWLAGHIAHKAKNLSVLPSPVLAIFAASKPESSCKNSSARVRLLTVSRFAPEKNIVWLIDMFALLAARSPGRYQFSLVGYGPQLALLRYHAYERRGLSRDDIVFTERPPKQELLKAYQEADLFIYASQSETQGIVLIEALSQATPVIALDGPAIGDTIKSHENGFIVNSREEMIEKIEHLSVNPEIYQKLSERAYKSSQSYTASAITKKLIERYRALL